MPTVLSEGALEFEFGPRWNVALKWDDSPAYRQGIQKLESSKAVDFLAMSAEKMLMIEVKDFRGARIENRSRISNGRLFDEVGLKVRDTVAGILGAVRTGDDAELRALVDHLVKKKLLLVILWLEEDRSADASPRSDVQRRRSRLGAMTQELKQRLRWLNPRVLVCSRRGSTLDDQAVTVRSR